MKTTIAGVVIGGIAGIVGWWSLVVELSLTDLWSLIGCVVGLGAVGGVVAYKMWERSYYG